MTVCFYAGEGTELSEESPVSIFSVSDFHNGYIMYVQTDHKGKEPMRDSFILVVEDGKNRSPPISIAITIQVWLFSC